MQSVEGKWETRMANLGGIKVECVETAPPLKKYRGFFFCGEGASGTPASIKALDFQNHSSVGRV